MRRAEKGVPMSFNNETVLRILIECTDYILGRLKGEELRLSNYDRLCDSLLTTNITEDTYYKSIFKDYYAMNKGWNSRWDEQYFSLLERAKFHNNTTFTTVLYELHKVTNRIETSFSSKLIATINPEMPVYDKWVRENLGLKEPYPAMPVKRRMLRFVTMYNELQPKVTGMIEDSKFEKLRTSFNQTFPQYEHFTDTKKLDLFLWQARLGLYPLVPCVIQLKEIGYRINGR